jgi:hypothetical protein
MCHALCIAFLWKTAPHEERRMSIEGINTAMTPLQFSRALSSRRAVETTESSSKRWGLPGQAGTAAERLGAQVEVAQASRALLPPVPKDRFHWTYKPIPGKVAAKRLPQVADSAYWSFGLNRLG